MQSSLSQSASFPIETSPSKHDCNKEAKRRVHRDSISMALSIVVSTLLFGIADSVPCRSNQDCETLLRKGSECWDGSCTNPYAKGGCLKNHLPEEFTNIRTCNSQDSQELIDDETFCRPSEMDYMEVRIGSQNWEGAFFTVWIMQVLLSELLNVPVSIETGERDKNVNFYHIHSAGSIARAPPYW